MDSYSKGVLVLGLSPALPLSADPKGSPPRGPGLARARLPTETAAACGHLEELRSLLAQSSWEVVSPLPIMPHVLRFFLRCIVPSPSDPDSHCTGGREEAKTRKSTRCNPFCL